MKIFIDLIKKIFEFLQSSSGESSSKRLIWISTGIALIVEFFRAMDQLIIGGHASDAVDLFIYFMIFVAISGGLVTLEVIGQFVEAIAKLKYNKENGRRDDRALD